MEPKDAPRRANKRDRSRTNSPRDTKRARQSSTPAKPVFGRLQVTADTDGISQVTSHRPGQAVVDLIADDVFALHGPREQAHEMLDKIMKHSNGSVFTAVYRFEPGPQASRDDKNTGHASAVAPDLSGSPPPLLSHSTEGFFSSPLSIKLKHGTGLDSSGTTDQQTGGLFEGRRNDREVAKQEATMPSTSNGQAQRPTTDGQEDDMLSPDFTPSRRQGFKKAPDPDSHLKFKDLDFDSRDFEFLKRDQDCADVVCGSCSGKGHHFLDCVWPDARGDLVGCPFCNTKEHVMDNCPQQPTLNDFEWTHILVFRRANKPLLRTTRSWYHYAELANRYATGAAVHGTMDAHEWNYLLSKGFTWTRSFSQNLVKSSNLSRGPWLRYNYKNDSAAQCELKRDPETMNHSVVFSNDRLKDERFIPR
ncbi:hypothetical protein BDP81DRAFT_473834 [Colletotrichum phormii]|uniref:Uncharacterized protein n=1 Tax=Colletotrichum phormii TaxID=359342 RepID=A0AAI9ZN42_9PEZI|nr:uncharacterized protein BDP81DRAFT_473834 [Colletotrichum phormii]KAK1633689.1 hypothetical protein BDP81DRAFT_473834 [Colletotrichum phormii]